MEAGDRARYADAIVEAGVGLRRGELLVVQAQPQHRELVVAIAEAAYRRGARHVHLDTVDQLVAAARFRHGGRAAIGGNAPWIRQRGRALLQPDTALVGIQGEGDPGAYAGLDSARIAEHELESRRPVRFLVEGIRASRVRWALAAWPTDAWAGLVYPELPLLEARRRLGRDLLSFCRVAAADGDGTEGWVAHMKTLETRSRKLTRLGLERLELRAPGTELTVGLARGGIWRGGRERTTHGRMTSPNMPTEEVFTSPAPAATEGTFRCSRPLNFRGRLIEGIRGEFHGGRLVRLDADRDEERDLLAALVDTDADARRLGEVALVDSSSRIGRAGRTYFETLIDENAAAHIAFGGGFPNTRPAGAPRVNSSSLHLDVMVGTDDLDVTGYAARGRRVPLIAGGVWAF
jgi:aminopeptidase